MVPSLTPVKTKCTPVSSCIMEYGRHREKTAAVVLELHISGVTGVFHASEEFSFSPGLRLPHQTHPLRSVPASMINAHNTDHTNFKACI